MLAANHHASGSCSPICWAQTGPCPSLPWPAQKSDPSTGGAPDGNGSVTGTSAVPFQASCPAAIPRDGYIEQLTDRGAGGMRVPIPAARTLDPPQDSMRLPRATIGGAGSDCPGILIETVWFVRFRSLKRPRRIAGTWNATTAGGAGDPSVTTMRTCRRSWLAVRSQVLLSSSSIVSLSVSAASSWPASSLIVVPLLFWLGATCSGLHSAGRGPAHYALRPRSSRSLTGPG
jgi:hypothetical protein